MINEYEIYIFSIFKLDILSFFPGLSEYLDTQLDIQSAVSIPNRD